MLQINSNSNNSLLTESNSLQNESGKSARLFTDEKIAKIFWYAMGTLLALVAVGAIVAVAVFCPATMLVMPIALSIFPFLGSGYAFWYGSTIRDYHNPAALEKMKEAAETKSMDTLIQEHGTENLRKYKIVSDERIQEHQRLYDQGKKLECALAGDYREACQTLDEKYPKRLEKQISVCKGEKYQKEREIDSLKWKYYHEAQEILFSKERHVSEIEANLSASDGDYVYTYGAKQQLKQQREALETKKNTQIATLQESIDTLNKNLAAVKKDPKAKEDQKKYDLETKILSRQKENNESFLEKHYPKYRGLSLDGSLPQQPQTINSKPCGISNAKPDRL